VRRALLLTLLLAACGDERLIYIPPEPDSGPPAEDGTRWRDPLEVDAGPEAGPEPESCEIELVWPLEGAPQGECRPGWRDCNGLGAPPLLPTELDSDCDGINDEDCAPWAEIIVIDGSGSMNPWRQWVNNALCALDGRNDLLRSVVVFGGRYTQPHYSIVSWGGNMCVSLPHMSGQEHAGWAVEEASNLVGGWPPGHARLVVVVSDEPPQDPIAGSNGILRVIEACQDEGFELGVITKESHFPHWAGAVEACGGWVSTVNDLIYPLGGASPPCVEL